MNGFDLVSYVKKPTQESGVPLLVEDLAMPNLVRSKLTRR